MRMAVMAIAGALVLAATPTWSKVDPDCVRVISNEPANGPLLVAILKGQKGKLFHTAGGCEGECNRASDTLLKELVVKGVPRDVAEKKLKDLGRCACHLAFET